MQPSEVGPFSPAGVLLEALRRRRVSSVELVELHQKRAEQYNAALRALATLNFEEALVAAAEADRLRATGGERPLLGLPVTIKDCIPVRGLPATGGVVVRASTISQTDAPPVARLRAAGAIVIATTNVPPYAGDWQSDNPIFGRSVNPWDATRTPGGSTGGGAAAVAAGLTPLELGGDYIGSIRIPAAFCGIFGHKTSYSALPGTGHFPLSHLPNPVPPFAVLGPLARSADDLELVLDVAAGPEIGEDVAWHLEIPRARYGRLDEFRVALLPPIPWLPVDPEILAAIARVAGCLRSVGATVQEAQPALFGDLRDHHALYVTMIEASNAGRLGPEERAVRVRELRASGDEFRAAMADGMQSSGGNMTGYFLRRELYRESYREFFKTWDVLIAPVFPVNAFPHVTGSQDERYFEIEGRAVPYDRGGVYPGLANLSGQPATAIPVGRSGSGLPIGIQAIGPYLEDRTPIQFARLLAAELGGFVSPPNYTTVP